MINKEVKVLNQVVSDNYALYHGDSCEVTKALDDNSIDYIIYSPPFSELYVFSDDIRDLSNCRDYDQFFKQYIYMIKEQFRIIKTGRLVSVHCMNLMYTKNSFGFIGIKDFRGDIIRAFEKEGFIFHSEATIWKDPLIAAQRTKSLGLLYGQLEKDSNMSRQGLPDYLLTFRKDGENKEPISHPDGFKVYAGKDEPSRESNKGVKWDHEVWRRYASPVWMDIRQTKILKRFAAKGENDEKHISPLQLDTIERAITLYSNEGDIVLDPFGGIGSTPYKAIEMGRKAIACELKESYFNQMVPNIAKITEQVKNEQRTLFD
jgi:DNA modification methylase